MVSARWHRRRWLLAATSAPGRLGISAAVLVGATTHFCSSVLFISVAPFLHLAIFAIFAHLSCKLALSTHACIYLSDSFATMPQVSCHIDRGGLGDGPFSCSLSAARGISLGPWQRRGGGLELRFRPTNEFLYSLISLLSTMTRGALMYFKKKR